MFQAAGSSELANLTFWFEVELIYIYIYLYFFSTRHVSFFLEGSIFCFQTDPISESQCISAWHAAAGCQAER